MNALPYQAEWVNGRPPAGLPMPPATSTNPAPALPSPVPATTRSALPNPFMPVKQPPKHGLLGSAVDGFMRGFDPAGRKARIDEGKAADQESRQKEIATLQGIRKMPVEQRMQLLPQISQAMGGQQIPESAMSDAELDAALALRMGEAGMVEQPMTAFQQESLAIEREKLKAPGHPVEWKTETAGDGSMYQVNPVTGETRPLNIKGKVEGAGGFTLGEKQVRYDADGNVIARGPSPPPADPNAPPDPESIRLEREFAKDWKSVDNNFKDIDGQYKRMQTLATRQDAAGDLALIVSFTKMLDPGSVAREGEVKLTQSAASLVDQALIWADRLKKGNTLLPPDLRKAYLDAAGQMHGIYSDSYQRLAQNYQQTAQSYGFDPQRVMMGYDAPGGEAAGGPDLDRLFASAPKMVQDWLGGMGEMFQRPGQAQSASRAAQASSIPPEAAAELRANPTEDEMIQFDEVFGAGAAAEVLNGAR